MGSLNVMKHALVPVHHLVPEEDEEEILEKLDARKDQLPKILKADPALKQLIEKHGDIKKGRLIQIDRISKTAGISKAYRLVVERE